MTINPGAMTTFRIDHPTNQRSMCLAYWAAAAEFAGMPTWTRSPLPNVAAARAVTPGIINAYPVKGRPAFLWFGTDIGYWDGNVAWFTDATWGNVGSLTIEQRLANLRALHGVTDNYLGYSENLYGTPIAEPSPVTAPVTGNQTDKDENQMHFAGLFRTNTDNPNAPTYGLWIDETGHKARPMLSQELAVMAGHNTTGLPDDEVNALVS